MRSRYAAFALGLGEYLFDSLAASHPDRAAPREAAIRELGRAREQQRFLRLVVLASSANETESEGEVLFYARIFEKGQDRSFAELSRFVREDGAWRYESGLLVPGRDLPADPTTLDREAFLALVTR
jgi:SEC-C motif-containing protein